MADSLRSYWNYDALLYWRCGDRPTNRLRASFDTVLTEIKAMLPQIADTEIAGAVKLVRNL
jgi:hypothetical protein